MKNKERLFDRFSRVLTLLMSKKKRGKRIRFVEEERVGNLGSLWWGRERERIRRVSGVMTYEWVLQSVFELAWCTWFNVSNTTKPWKIGPS
jgi:hypothetical protein